MSNVQVTLRAGLKVGEAIHTDAELRPSTVGDLLAACEDAGRPVQVEPGEWELVSSPQVLAVHLLRRQVVRVGTRPGPLTAAEIGRLTMEDLTLLQVAAQEMEAASQGGTRAGESGSGSGDAPSGAPASR